MNTNAQNAFMELEYPYEMKRQSVGSGIEIAYADLGKGHPVLFIHGMGSYAKAWQKNIKELQNHFRCIVIDLPGYGKSSKGQFNADMTFHKEHLFALMDSLNINEFSIAGHSMGAQIAMHMALENKERVKSLILTAPAGIETFSEVEKNMFRAITPEQTAAVSDEQYKVNLSLNFYEMPEEAEFMYEDRMTIKNSPDFMNYCHTVTQGIKGMVNEPVFDKLSELSQPVLLIYGKQDKLIPNKYLHPDQTIESLASNAQKQIKDVNIQLIDQAGHFVHFEQPELTNNLIINFIN
ncbi:alpha/beta fold hydrolase [Marinigracilibium pacificum]|uniref:Alpha/beta hydrolase n=1 Tax=Marinigracilibium pacificum TaxID=2729599 RepID=A0A848IU68_9BACT|nr:alpha/beta hydrolase [Marinigracilibium pacificum]NMM47276.1 alpha/beta hydrolase [Marinigracilibium pacificum]